MPTERALLRHSPEFTDDPAATDSVRALIAEQSSLQQLSFKYLSIQCGKSHSWLSSFMTQHTPRYLRLAQRVKLAKLLNVPEELLCVPGQITSNGRATKMRNFTPVQDTAELCAKVEHLADVVASLARTIERQHTQPSKRSRASVDA